MNLLKNHGVAKESDCSYKASESNCPAGTKAAYQISSWSRSSDKSTIQRAVHTGGVNVGFAVYSDFSYYKSGYYAYTNGYKRGYHAVAIFGYDSQGWIVRNSWGTGWGERGNFKILYSQMNNVIQFGTSFGGSYFITR